MSGSPVDASPLTVVVADPNEDMRAYIGASLWAMAAVRVHEASSGVEALHLSRGLRPSLVIASQSLAQVSCGSLCRALRANPETEHIPVLVIANHRSDARDGPPFEDSVPRPMSRRAVLSTPFNATQLRATIERLLGHTMPSA